MSWSIWWSRNSLIFRGVAPSLQNCKAFFIKELFLSLVRAKEAAMPAIRIWLDNRRLKKKKKPCCFLYLRQINEARPVAGQCFLIPARPRYNTARYNTPHLLLAQPVQVGEDRSSTSRRHACANKTLAKSI